MTDNFNHLVTFIEEVKQDHQHKEGNVYQAVAETCRVILAYAEDLRAIASPTDNGELLPCPFCGKSEIKLHGDDHSKFKLCRVSCNTCEYGGPNFKTREEASTWWNTRTEN